MCLSHATVDSDLSSDDASVKAEAIHNCFDKRWCSFICILAVSSVVNKTIFTFYPDFGDVKYKLLFTQEVKPTIVVKNNETNDKFYRKVAFPRFTESVKFMSQSRETASKLKPHRGLGTRLPSP